MNQPFLNLAARAGADPLLTQGSSGNLSQKIRGKLLIKASGKWMADALHSDIFVALDHAAVLRESVERGLDPAERFPGASLETALHAILPHPVVLHVHSVNTIAWAVREDGAEQLTPLLNGLRWRWIPFVDSGLPLAWSIEASLAEGPADVFVLGNHGLVVAGESPELVGQLLDEVEARVAIRPRQLPPVDYAALQELASAGGWQIPADDAIHALAIDPAAVRILAGGLLYPCQAIFSHARTAELFRAIAQPHNGAELQADRQLIPIAQLGVLVNRAAEPADLAMLAGLAQVVLRLPADAPIRYLTEADLAGLSSEAAARYRGLACAR